ncbi:MAG TPA: tryptophan--tRNA ligase [Dehalococcoidia bacterium]|jgi:tryptophanyl-tRNA synthetase|nr:tryptophan--tRNA ligase [Dehalococcoidia bacterium]
MKDQKRILTGIRPTGPLHLGHYSGALENWVRLQAEYDCYFLIADYQVSDYADDIPRVRDSVWEVALDWLAVGLDPENNSFVIESLVPENAELTAHLSWFLPLSMLERNPTLKTEMAALENPEEGGKERKSVPVAFYNYPVMQVANILMPRAHLVPVGEDQLPHIELTRETARRFNRRFKEVFPEPQGLVGRVPRLVGTDGNAKMSKSLNNTIDIRDSAEVVAKKIRRMYGGPPRGATEPGDPAENPVFLYLEAFHPNPGEVTDLEDRYRKVGMPNKELKEILTKSVNDLMDPFRERRAFYEARMPLVKEALHEGSARAQKLARETIEMVRDALDLGYAERT